MEFVELEIMNSLKKILNLHLVDATAGVSLGNPLWALIETKLMGMKPETSWDAKLLGTALAYGGMSFLYFRGRDLSQGIFGLDEDSEPRSLFIHDTAYSLAYSVSVSPITYSIAKYCSGSDEGIFWPVLVAAAGSLVLGRVTGYVNDKFRRLCGIEVDRKTGEIYYTKEREEKEKSPLKKESQSGLEELTRNEDERLLVGALTAVAEEYNSNFDFNSRGFQDEGYDEEPRDITGTDLDRPNPEIVCPEKKPGYFSSHMKKAAASAIALSSAALTYTYYQFLR